MVRICGGFLMEYITIVALVILCQIPHVHITPSQGSVVGRESQQRNERDKNRILTQIMGTQWIRLQGY